MKGVLSQRQKFDYISSSAEGLERNNPRRENNSKGESISIYNPRRDSNLKRDIPWDQTLVPHLNPQSSGIPFSLFSFCKKSSSSNCPHANPYPQNSVFVVFSSQQLILFRIPTQCSALARLRVREEFVAS